MKLIRDNESGMTLVEILVVIVVLGLLIGVIAGGVFQRGDDAKAQINVVKMEKLKSSIQTYRLQFNSYPSKIEDLVKASASVKDTGKLFTPLASEEDLKDVWGYPYIYQTQNNGRSFTLTSQGSDGVPGGEGGKQDVTLRP